MPLWSVKLSHIFLIWSSGEFGGTFSAMSCSLGLSWAGLARWQGVSSCWRALCCEGWFCSSVWVGDASVWTSTRRQLLHFWTLYCSSCGSSSPRPHLRWLCQEKQKLGEEAYHSMSWGFSWTDQLKNSLILTHWNCKWLSLKMDALWVQVFQSRLCMYSTVCAVQRKYCESNWPAWASEAALFITHHNMNLYGTLIDTLLSPKIIIKCLNGTIPRA